MNKLDYQEYQEDKQHGDASFPYDTYLCTIPLDFTNVPVHWHDEMEVIYIKKGCGFVTVNLTEYHVWAGSVVIVLPGQLHSITQEKGKTMEYENIIFHPNLLYSNHYDYCNRDFFNPLFSGKILVPTHFYEETICYHEIVTILDACDQINAEKVEGYLFLLKSQLFKLFFLLANQCSFMAPDAADTTVLDKMRPVIKYVEMHYTENISIETAAKIAAYSPSHFMKCFKAAFQCSFIEYVNEYRLSEAAKLLLHTNDTILSIASKAGYDNLSYFNRSFKKKYGVTPGQYRAKAR